MRGVVYFTIFFLLGCSSRQAKHDPLLPDEKEVFINYFIKNQCSTYYHFAHDTLNPVLSRIIGYDENNFEKEIIYRGYESYVDATSLSFFDSTGKLALSYYRMDNEGNKGRLTKTYYQYNENGLMSKDVSYSFERRLLNNSDKGFGRSGGCLVTEEDYEKNRTWEIASIWEYSYDSEGRLVEKYSPLGNSGQNRYLYLYDDMGRLIQEKSLNETEAIWVEDYSYYDGGYEYSRVWYENGERRKDWDGSYMSIDTFRFKTSKSGNVIERLVIEGGGRKVSCQKKTYDERNRIVRNEIYDGKDKLLGFYSYQYINSEYPIAKVIVVKDDK